jgi:hypothetical protein
MSTADYKVRFLKYCREITAESLYVLALDTCVRLPSYFWTMPSSSSGKYHPPDERGLHGEVIHTFRVYRASMLLCESAGVSESEKNQVRFAALFHDGAQRGLGATPSEWSVDEHPQLIVDLIQSICEYQTSYISDTMLMILTHTGPWGKEKPDTQLEWILHYADNLASKMHLIMNESEVP